MNPTDYVFVGIKDIYNNKKLYNAFKYLFALINENGTYIRNDNDPFSPNNFGKGKSIITNDGNNQNVKLTKEGGLYYLPVTIGNLTKNFILDSGASDVLISQEIEKKLIDNKKITKSNYLSPSLYKIADGSIIECRRLLLPEIKIGNYIVKNVIASIISNGNTLLLGKSFLDKFQSWTIDNNKQILKLEK
jgi:clan AA aspartic protease (TIGR02281 family)